MIEYEWRSDLDADAARELRELTGAASAEDAEAGFATIEAPGSRAGPGARHLLVRLRDGEPLRGVDVPGLVACLRVDVDGDGVGTAQYVVHPAARSRGVTTLLLERVGLDLAADGGWAGTGARTLRTWARGDHPAAARAARRFGSAEARLLWRLVRPLGEDGHRLPARPDAGAVRRARTDAEVRAATRLLGDTGQDTVLVVPDEGGDEGAVGAVGAIRVDVGASVIRRVAVDARARGRGAGRALLSAALLRIADRGAAEARMAVDAADEALVHLCRALGFEHERTDVLYEL